MQQQQPTQPPPQPPPQQLPQKVPQRAVATEEVVALAASPKERSVEDDEEEEVSFEESSWAFPLLLGNTRCDGVVLIGTATSAYLVLLLFLTAAVQVAFVLLLADRNSGMIDPMDDEAVEELRNWRRTVAHDYKYFNQLEQASLARRVCRSSESEGTSRRTGSSLELAGVQLQLYEDLCDYLGNDGDGTRGNGKVMCILALTVWILTMLQEIFACYASSVAVACLPRGRTSTFSRNNADRALTFTAVSRTKLACFQFVSLCRALIGLNLLYFGGLFLIYTPNMGDLLLNAVAIEFVILVDELVFAALAPKKVRALVAGAAALSSPPPPQWMRGWGLRLDPRAVIKSIAFTALIIAALQIWLNPQIEIMVQARDAMCAGDTDFVITRDGLGAIAWAYPPGLRTDAVYNRNFPDGKPPQMDYNATSTKWPTYADSVIEVLLRQQGREYFDCGIDTCYVPDSAVGYVDRPGRPDCCHVSKSRVPSTEAGRFSIAIKATETTVDANRLWNPSCFDVLGAGGGYDSLLQGAVGDALETRCEEGCPADAPICLDGVCVASATCPDVQRFCRNNSVAGVRVRQLCPVTCGCDAPRHPLALSLPASGCGPRCVYSGNYLAKRAALPCADVDVDDADFVAFLDDWLAVAQTWPSDWLQGSQSFIAALRQHGCDLLGNETTMNEWVASGGFPPYIFGVNMCVENGFFMPVKPLSYFCPAACGCRSGDVHCPDACPMRTAETPTCPDAQRAAAAGQLSPNCPVTDPRNYGAKNANTSSGV